MRNITIIFLLYGLFATVPTARAEDLARSYWWACPADLNQPVRPEYTDPDIEIGATEVRADNTRIVKDGTTFFSGNVEIIRGPRSVRGNEVSYDDNARFFDIAGDAHIWDPSLIWRGEHATFDMNSDKFQLRDGYFWLAKGRGRGNAKLIEHNLSTNISILRGLDYTTCPESRQDWKIAAGRIKLDHDKDRGSATNAVLKIRDVPVLYIPYISFPLSDKRKSGFLPPSFGTTNNSGFDLRIPYYFNIAPQHDATVTPRWLTDRGGMLGAEYRFLAENVEGKIGGEYLPTDQVDNGNTRSHFVFDYTQHWDQRRGRLRARVQNVSDTRYFEDFGNSLSSSSQRFLDRRLDFSYRRRGIFALSGIVQNYQKIDDTTARSPYERLPQINFAMKSQAKHLRPRFEFLAQTTYFDRDDSVTGGRIDLSPAMSLSYIKPYARITPTLKLRQTEYFLDDDDPRNVGNRFADRESRTVPVASVDARLFAERRTSLFGKPMFQTFEPRAYYLYVPKDGQDDIPVFDSGTYNFRFANLFRDNRFTGRDRIGDANQLALTATSRLVNLETGREILRGSFGQIYYFEDREVGLPNGRGINDDDVSDLIAELVATIDGVWSARATLQWDPNDSKTERSVLNLRYRPGNGAVVNASYRLSREVSDIEQTDVSMRLPLTTGLSLVGRWNYSLQNKETLEGVAGFEYESCCWGIRIVGRRFLKNAEGEFETAFFTQFVLKGLGGYGRSTESFLQKSIPGYRSFF